MRKILINVCTPYITFNYKESSENANLLHTNIISSNELAFGEEYIKENALIVSSFIEEIVKENGVKKIKIKDQDLGLIILDFFRNTKEIEELYIEDKNPLSFDLYMKIVKCKYLKKVDCQCVPKYILEQLDKHKIVVESRDEIMFTSYFMQKNNLMNYAKIYYKNYIVIDKELDDNDLTDLDTFCKINKYLKNIHLELFDKATINKVVAMCFKYNHKNIKINIHQNINDIKTVEYLKKINKNYSKKYHISIKLIYSDEYVSNNLFSQLIVNNIKMCCFIILGIFAVFFLVVGYNNIKDLSKIKKINNNLATIVDETKENVSNVNKVDEDGQTKKVSELYLSLLQENADTKGWLKINNTTIDYPVVQSKDNEYYLNHDYDNNKNYNGWIFADYRNNFETLDDNTIIYGHNKYLNQTMFGTLDKVLDEDWLSFEENRTITFNTLYEEHTFKIFSVYKVNNTNDYLITSFSSEDAFKKYLNFVTKRSIKNFNETVTPEDKILTLSTCVDKNKRLVVHAVMIR